MGRPTPTKGLLVAGASLALFSAAAEWGFRALAPGRLAGYERMQQARQYLAEGSRQFEPRPHTSYGLRRGETTNKLGFRGPEWTREKEPGVLRIACVGASTTEGGNARGRVGSYPWQLERVLEEETGRRFEVMNLGVSGWTTAESLVNWLLCAQDYEPDVVIVHHAVNDVNPRMRRDFRMDYLHWRHEWREPHRSAVHRYVVAHSELYSWLTIRNLHVGITDLTATGAPEKWTDPVAETAAAFRRNLVSLGEDAEAQGARVVLMTMPYHPGRPDSRPVTARVTHEHNEILREICREKGWMLADAEPLLEWFPEQAEAEFLDSVHLQPRGNLAKAIIAARVLTREWLPTLPPAEDGGR